MARLSWLFPAFLTLVTGCAVVAPRGPLLAVHLERNVVQRSDSGTAQVTALLQNVGGAAAYFVGCATPVGAWVEVATATGWRDAYGLDTACTTQIIPARIELAPGHQLNVHYTLGQAGRYRLRFTFGASPQQPYVYHQTSPEFDVE